MNGSSALYLPVTDLAMVVRTDFSDDDTWREVARAVLDGDSLFPNPTEQTTVPIRRSTGGTDTGQRAVVRQQVDMPLLMVLDDPRFDGVSAHQVRELMRPVDMVFVADAATNSGEHALLALHHPARDEREDFRLTPASVENVAVVLQVGKLLWDEVLGDRGDDGVVRREL
ncbi:DUF6924 domain-containing protein [Kineosporia succinea]|uniref:DUF6924 domain-containing protein n=1 Tax=Kineosporia succinea TaxID=84632 RepID=A0ABT9PA23_9ACTN|nr:hypothetical protein [Kineosporia succinea]MDP9829549.1 hypothetical protein [Kineosporia succinea]